MTCSAGYIGRFAPSPTGPLHAGSLVAALGSWLDARAFGGGRGGRWLVRIEDVDTPRCIPGAGEFILEQLARCGLVPDEPPLWQSARGTLYQHALDHLVARGDAYPCACSRKDIEEAQLALGHARERHAALPYPGTCRNGLHGRTGRSWRFRVPAGLPPTRWMDRRLGAQQQDVAAQVGDFVLRRADGLWAYQLAVVVDDAAQGITHIVRGEDLADNTPRQILLQGALGVSTPQYLHTPLVLGGNSEKLSKQNGAQALDLTRPLQALEQAARALGLPALEHSHNTCTGDALAQWANAWPGNYNGPS